MAVISEVSVKADRGEARTWLAGWQAGCTFLFQQDRLEDAFRFGHASVFVLACTFTYFTKKAARERIMKPTASHHHQRQQHQQQQKQRIRAVETLAGRANLAPSIGRCGCITRACAGAGPPPPPDHGRPIPTRRPHAPRGAIRTVSCTHAYAAWPLKSTVLCVRTHYLGVVVCMYSCTVLTAVCVPGRAGRPSHGQGPVPEPGIVRPHI